MKEIVQKLCIVGLVALLAMSGLLYFWTTSGTIKSITATTTSQTNTSAIGGQNVVPPYDCPKPSANSELLCDILPVGYQIAPRLVNAPPPYCLAGMSTAACALLKQTQANGVCDPNETYDTSPLDCGCNGALVPDPFTGRCAAPASVCLLQQQGGQG